MRSWFLVGAVAATCFALRAATPLLLRGRELPPALARRLESAITPLLASLAAVQLFTSNGHLGIDDRAAGVLAAAFLFGRRRSLPLALASAVLVTALLRLLRT
jgi:hypothetical protein